MAEILDTIMFMNQKNQLSSTANAPDPKAGKAAGSLPDGRPLVLIVEDEPDVAELIRYNLSRDGYATLIAESGDAAIKAAQRSTPDLVLLDIMLPGMNGWEVCQTIRDSAICRHIPIVMVSALTSDENRIKGLSLGADDFITKPFSVQELLIKTRNILERQALIKELRLRDEERDSAERFLLHEMRSAISIIGGFSSLAVRRNESKTYLAHINSSALHMETLLDDFSLLAKLEKGRGALPRDEFDVAAIAAMLGDSFRESAAVRHISITIESPSSLKAVGNAGAFRQILANLISNAIKYNQAHGSVRITCERAEDKILLSVIDAGLGIRKEELNNVFNKFYRARGSENVPGSGLGLYIAKLLAEAMGASISVTSILGEGTTFTLFIPDAARKAVGRSTQ